MTRFKLHTGRSLCAAEWTTFESASICVHLRIEGSGSSLVARISRLKTVLHRIIRSSTPSIFAYLAYFAVRR
jgi:hypothetical protein